MKRRKVGPIGIVVADGVLRAAQHSERGLVQANVPVGDSLKKDLRQLLAAAPFVGREVVLGLEGSGILVESFALPAGAAKDVRKFCQDRLKGDPLFNPEKAQLGVTVENVPSEQAPPVAIMAAMNKQRLADLVTACHESELDIHAVESSALAAWRGWAVEGLSCRLVVAGSSAAVLAGHGEDLQFCRILEAPVQPDDLTATLARAATLLGVEPFARVETAGLEPDLRAALGAGAGVELVEPAQPPTDAAAAGLATEGRVQADFTPPEERVRRERRKVRKIGIAMAVGFGLLVLGAGVLGAEKLSRLEDQRTMLEQRRDIVRADRRELEKVTADLAREQANEATIADARPGHRLSTLFTIIASAASDSISFETVKINDIVSAAAKTAAKGSGPVDRMLEVRMNGLARTSPAVRQFTDALLATGAFRDVRVEASERVLLGVGIEGQRFRIYAMAETH